MNELIMLCAIVAGLWGLFLWLRVPSVLVFLSILLGQLLATEVGFDAYEFTASVARINDPHLVQLALLLLPVLLSLLFLKGKLAKSKLVTEAIPLLFAAATLVLFASPFVPKLGEILDTAAHNNLETYRSLIIVCASVSILIMTWLTYGRGGKDHHGKHHK